MNHVFAVFLEIHIWGKRKMRDRSKKSIIPQGNSSHIFPSTYSTLSSRNGNVNYQTIRYSITTISNSSSPTVQTLLRILSMLSFVHYLFFLRSMLVRSSLSALMYVRTIFCLNINQILLKTSQQFIDINKFYSMYLQNRFI